MGTGKISMSVNELGSSLGLKLNKDDSEYSTGKHKSTSFGGYSYNDSVKKSKTSKVNSGIRISFKDYYKTVFKINFSKNHMNEISSCYIDNHSETCFLGSKFRVTFKTYQVCYVSPFLDEYKPMSSVPIVTGCIAWDDSDSGITYILEFNKSLWFGEKM